MLYYLNFNNYHRFNKDVDTPKFLPCGYTICTRCETEIKLINNNKFDCALCGNTHVKSNQDFPINQALKNFKKFNFSSKFPQLVEKIQKIDSIILPLEETIANMESKIINYCDGLRFQIDLKTDSSIEILNKAREEFLGKIKEF